jgi:hypothetical protein
VTNRAIAQARLRNSRLVGPPLASADEVVSWFGAVQSQDVPGALWGIAQRMPAGRTIDEPGAAMDDGRIVRTHGPRPTWHFLAPQDLRWILALVGPRVHQVAGTMYRRLGLDASAFRRAEDAMRAAMAGRPPLTRAELREVIASAGIDVGDNLVTLHLGMHAELEAVICNGPRRGKQATYVLVDEHVPPVPPLDRDDALRELAIRYFRSHGPALANDMAWWSGLTVGEVRRGIEIAGSALEGRRVDDKAYWAAAGAFDPEPGLVPDSHIILLPNYDEYLGSYRDYSPVFDAALPRARTVADVLGTHIVLRDGLVVGGWRRALGPRQVTVTVTLLIQLTTAEIAALEDAASAFGRFVGLPVDLRASSS